MVTPEQGTATALNLASQAAELLDAIGDRAGAMRLRHTVATIRNDARYSVPEGLMVPTTLMRMALALFDWEGSDLAGNTAVHLQTAIDCVRGAMPLKEGEEIDPDLLVPILFDPPPGQLN